MEVCKARLTRGKKEDGVWVLAFNRKPEQQRSKLFLVPFRCSQKTDGDLCNDCKGRAERTREHVRRCNGKYVGNQDSLIHGLVGEEPPEWSHVYMGKWFCDFKARKGLEISEEAERRAEAALVSCPKGLDASHIEMPRAKKVLEDAATEVAVAVAAPKKFKTKKALNAEAPVVAVAEPATATAPVQKPKAVRKPKQVAPKVLSPVGIINPAPLHDIEVVKIAVKKFEIDGRTIYLSTKKDKVYDLKFNYLGRYNRADECIETKYPDSDRE